MEIVYLDIYVFLSPCFQKPKALRILKNLSCQLLDIAYFKLDCFSNE